jgi:phosphatidylglycerophosphatase A
MTRHQASRRRSANLAYRWLSPQPSASVTFLRRRGHSVRSRASRAGGFSFDAIYFAFALLLIVSLVGVWTASRAAAYLGAKDPQIIVIDEVSGQYLALFVASLWPTHVALQIPCGPAYTTVIGAPLNWKCVLAGFILFRVFDIWKPFPARQAESLPRGWGIMADDWIAGLYAALGLWILRAAGL